MSREWRPGDVALVTWRDRYGPCPLESTEVAQFLGSEWSWAGGAIDLAWVINARPLVVIDAEDREQVERLGKAIFDNGFRAVGRLSDALRQFADPKPPKPEEPTGLGAVVEDAEGVRWVRLLRAGDDSTADDWKRSYVGLDSDENWHHYADIDAVRVLSPGVNE